MFRVGEVTKGSHPIQARDVHIAQNKKELLFMLRTSKTHMGNVKPQIVKITGLVSSKQGNVPQPTNPNNRYCPFKILHDFLAVRTGYTSIDEPFFVFRDKTPVSPAIFTKILKTTLTNAGYDARLYSSHSFRGGRSKDLLDMGIDIDTIRKLGRWSPKSTSVFAYLRY